MRILDDRLRLSPTDLSSFLGCHHRTGLDLSVAHGLLQAPHWKDPMVEALRERGQAHERGYVESLKAQGLEVVDLRAALDPVEATRTAIAEGVGAIVQAALEDGHWQGFADVLRRVETPSRLGSWSYEVYDTKLARETRGRTILQLSLYSDLLSKAQGKTPERFHVVTPDPATPIHSYRFEEHAAYYRLVRRQFVDTLARGAEAIRAATYPEPVDECEMCRWWKACDARRRKDDHLHFIANIRRIHRVELQNQGFGTLAATAALPMTIPFVPARGSTDTYDILRDQARLQAEQRRNGDPVYRLLPPAPGLGLARLPAPSPGDVFLDLEGAGFARDGGREYLFGLWTSKYRSWWARDDAQEQAAFEALIDLFTQAFKADPGMHIYHFGHYEPTAFKKLMGRYATRAEELDVLLRNERFVDLYTVVREGLRAGVESYSIKKLEPFYAFRREVPLTDANVNLRVVELALESNVGSDIPAPVAAAVEGYNRDDCRSTVELRAWLERLRAELEATGASILRPTIEVKEPSANVNALDADAEAIRKSLLEGLPGTASDPQDPTHPLWMLAYLIDWHRREEKAQWWDYFRIRDLSPDELLDEPKALIGLEFLGRMDVVTRKGGRPTGSVVDRYGYQSQEMDIGKGNALKLGDDTNLGRVEARDRVARTIDIKKGPSTAHLHPDVVFATDVFNTEGLQRAVMALATTPGEATCGLDLLFRRPPRLASGRRFERAVYETEIEFAVGVVGELEGGTLAIQGPPGAGKTHAGARMIRSLVKAGKRIGVTAVSHKVIRNLLDAVFRQAREAGEVVRLGQKVSDTDEGDESEVRLFDENDSAFEALRTKDIDVLGGTAWLWARPEAKQAVDVLFVDEAGQMSLANALAISRATKSLVLLGDPQQLEQPQKASHPQGIDVSALEHVLDGHKTMPEGRGIFLPTTWRLAPEVCAFTSEVFYEGKLHPRDGLENQRLVGTGGFDGAGLWWVGVDHDNNQNWSAEEVEAVARITEQLLSSTAGWVDAEGNERRLTPADLRIVAPYNAQVNRLIDRLGKDVPVGTVDKFQGQEAPVVVYSMATSRAEDAPRGMEFLYSLNRLNVATSRARCAAIVVASPRLFEPECRTPRQMQLANALCRFRELARPSELDKRAAAPYQRSARRLIIE